MSDQPVTTKEPPVVCPHCEKPLGMDVVANVQAQSKIKYTIWPSAGELMSTRAIGGQITAIGDLLKACGKEAGAPTETLIEKVETGAGGEITIHVLVARFDHEHAPAKRNARLKAARKSNAVTRPAAAAKGVTYA